MTVNKVMTMVNKDGRLLAIFSGMLIDVMLLISLVIYIGMKLAA